MGESNTNPTVKTSKFAYFNSITFFVIITVNGFCSVVPSSL